MHTGLERLWLFTYQINVKLRGGGQQADFGNAQKADAVVGGNLKRLKLAREMSGYGNQNVRESVSFPKYRNWRCTTVI